MMYKGTNPEILEKAVRICFNGNYDVLIKNIEERLKGTYHPKLFSKLDEDMPILKQLRQE